MKIEMVKRDLIDPDPNQPRKIFDEKKQIELANDIAVNGVLQAISVRPHPTEGGRYMVIFGERRWRASGPGYAELAELPVVVRHDVNDQQALEWQMAENGHRDDMHPLEEADGYRLMHERDGRDVDEIADLCGKSRAYIYAAMKLCALTEETRQAFMAGQIDKSRALLIARLPEQHHAAALKGILTGGSYDAGGVMTYRQAQGYVRDEFMLRLADAPFSTVDAQLVAAAGPCTTCDKRTGNQRELFADVVSDAREGGADVCTDAACYREKVDVHWARLKVDAEAKGHAIVEDADYKTNGSHGDKARVALDERVYDFGVHGEKTYRDLLGKRADAAVSAVARTEQGQIRELVNRADLPALLEAAGVKVPAPPAPDEGGKERYEREAKERRELERAVTLAAREAALARLDDAGQSVLWRLLARLAIRIAGADAQKEMLKLHEVTHEGPYSAGQAAALIRFADGLPLRALRDFTVETLLAEAGGWHANHHEADADPDEVLDRATGVEHAAELLDLDLTAIAAKAKDDLASPRAAKSGKKPKKATPAEEVNS